MTYLPSIAVQNKLNFEISPLEKFSIKNFSFFLVIFSNFWMFFQFTLHDATVYLVWFRLSYRLIWQCLHVDWPSEHSFECVRTYFWKIIIKFFFFQFLVEFRFLKFQIFMSFGSTIRWKSGRTSTSLRCKNFSGSAMSLKKILYVADT